MYTVATGQLDAQLLVQLVCAKTATPSTTAAAAGIRRDLSEVMRSFVAPDPDVRKNTIRMSRALSSKTLICRRSHLVRSTSFVFGFFLAVACSLPALNGCSVLFPTNDHEP